MARVGAVVVSMYSIYCVAVIPSASEKPPVLYVNLIVFSCSNGDVVYCFVSSLVLPLTVCDIATLQYPVVAVPPPVITTSYVFSGASFHVTTSPDIMMLSSSSTSYDSFFACGIIFVFEPLIGLFSLSRPISYTTTDVFRVADCIGCGFVFTDAENKAHVILTRQNIHIIIPIIIGAISRNIGSLSLVLFNFL